jgi:phosphatidylserine/phosphatidylglycerophosphate/cardiolipin synthase-like enzyme
MKTESKMIKRNSDLCQSWCFFDLRKNSQFRDGSCIHRHITKVAMPSHFVDMWNFQYHQKALNDVLRAAINWWCNNKHCPQSEQATVGYKYPVKCMKYLCVIEMVRRTPWTYHIILLIPLVSIKGQDVCISATAHLEVLSLQHVLYV